MSKVAKALRRTRLASNVSRTRACEASQERLHVRASAEKACGVPIRAAEVA
jgi:hypothetical protein